MLLLLLIVVVGCMACYVCFGVDGCRLFLCCFMLCVGLLYMSSFIAFGAQLLLVVGFMSLYVVCCLLLVLRGSLVVGLCVCVVVRRCLSWQLFVTCCSVFLVCCRLMVSLSAV